MEDKNKYLIFGTGSGTDYFLNNADQEDMYVILGFVDNSKDKQGTLYHGKQIFSPDELKNLDYDKIIISSLYDLEIRQQLSKMGIEKEKITSSIKNFSGSALKQVLMLDKNRELLSNKKMTIISNYCWGLFIYRFFDLEYQSPFIGSFFLAKDYAKLLNNLKYYLNQPPKITIQPIMNYCNFSLGDINMTFLHEKDPKILIKKWERRLERFDFDNLFIHAGSTCHEEFPDDFYENVKLNYENKLLIKTEKSVLYSKDKKITTTTEPIDLIKWFNKEL